MVDCGDHGNEGSFEITLPGDRRRWFLPAQQMMVDEGGGFVVTAQELLDQPRWLADAHLLSHIDRRILEEVTRQLATLLIDQDCEDAPRA